MFTFRIYVVTLISIQQLYLLPVFVLPLNPLQKNAMLGGALTGALISAASKKSKDNVVIDAIAGGAIATASTFLNYLI
jgi:hypothetical protein